MSKPTSEELHKIFYYDPETGLLIRKRSGKVVGTLSHGYLRIRIKDKKYSAHRIVYCMYHGYWPENQIDHINRIKHDNRIENLREVSQICNSRNSNVRKDNTSGVKGIIWDKREKKWRVRITINKKLIYIGRFKDFDSAVMARYITELNHNWNKCNEESSAYQYLVEHNLID